MKRKMTAGFTLIELILVLSLIGIVLGVGVSTLTSILRSSAKTTIFNQVKQNGDFAIEIMTRSIQSAVDVCTSTSPDDIVIYTTRVNCALPPSSAKRTRFRCTEGTTGPPPTDGKLERIEEDGTGGYIPGDLISSVKIKESSCVFTHSNTSPKRVTIKFTLMQEVSLGSSPDTSAEIPFQTEVTQRNF